jgi:aspartyl-tRNA(Asn)/glutamyl-tRNA(Gln) amidotransferase subunit A
MSELLLLDAHDLVAGYIAHDFSPLEVLDEVAERIGLIDRLNAFVALDLERAAVEAKRITAAYVRGEETRPLAGVPIAVKDIIDTADLTTAHGSSIFRGRRPTVDATVVRRAREHGAIVVGKTNTHEFAWGITTDNPHYGASANPWSPDRTPGGSSGGSAVAVATGVVPFALGTDTGGSIRIPAACCGVVGLKPTFGRVSTSGVFPLARSLDHIGLLTRTPRDARLVLSAIAGRDVADPATALTLAASPLKAEVVVGRCLPASGLSRDLGQAAAAALQRLERSGATTVDVELPEDYEHAFITIQGAEAHRLHRELGLFPQRAEDYGTDVRERLESTASISLSDYLQAVERRNAIRAAWSDVLRLVDVVVSPVSPVPPPRRGEYSIQHNGAAASFRDLVMPFTMPQNLTGFPACSVPLGFDQDGLPVAIQLTGRPGDERLLLQLAEKLIPATHEASAPSEAKVST